MGTTEKKALKRLGRGIFGLILSAIISFFTGDPKMILLTPAINAGGKYLRDKLAIPNIPF